MLHRFVLKSCPEFCQPSFKVFLAAALVFLNRICVFKVLCVYPVNALCAYSHSYLLF